MVTAHTWVSSKNSSSQPIDPLHSLIEAIRTRFATNAQADRSLASLLNSLSAHLQTRFEWDNSDIGLIQTEIQSPQLSRQVEQLKSKQRELLRDVDIMIGLARIALAEKQDTKYLAERYVAFQAKFAQHEANEKHLLLEAFGSDPTRNR